MNGKRSTCDLRSRSVGEHGRVEMPRADRCAAGVVPGPGPAGRGSGHEPGVPGRRGRLSSSLGLASGLQSLLPGRGHVHEPLVPRAQRPTAVSGRPSTVEHLRSGMPGYRLRLPTEVHPISAGVKGGIVGGLVMPMPALAYGLLSGHGIWYPVNLLAGMVLPGVDRMTVRRARAISPRRSCCWESSFTPSCRWFSA